MYPFEFDDVDRLFASVEATQPPAQFRGAVLAQVRDRARRRRRLGFLAASMSLAAVAVCSFLAGQHLVSSGALILLDALATDLELLSLAPGDAVLAIAELIPWGYLAATACGLMLLAIASRTLLQPAAWITIDVDRKELGR